jgi:hypothetical protein
LSLVAVKVIRVYDAAKRHQMLRELKSLCSPIVPQKVGLETPDNYPDTTMTPDNIPCIRMSLPSPASANLVSFYDAFTNPELGAVSLVLEYMDGGSLEVRE